MFSSVDTLRLSSSTITWILFPMAVISKELFYRKVDRSVHCRELHFWEANCLQAGLLSPFLITALAKGAGKFFLPIYVVSCLKFDLYATINENKKGRINLKTNI